MENELQLICQRTGLAGTIYWQNAQAENRCKRHYTKLLHLNVIQSLSPRQYILATILSYSQGSCENEHTIELRE